VKMRTEAERVCIAFRRTGDYLQSAEAWSTLMSFVATTKMTEPAAVPVGLVYDDPDITPLEKCRYEACWPIRAVVATKLPSGFSLVRVPAGIYAMTLHTGPYEDMRQSYVGLLGKALPRQSVELANEPVVEVYLNSPAVVSPEQLQTEICVRCV
jgi:AraC family transcriptional regulator